MALDHALLVSLLEKPSSGYDLARRFDRSIGFFWHATHQQIYRVLARMEQAGWTRVRLRPGDSAPDRREFSVTAAGRAELERWLAEASRPETPRDSLLVKVRGAAFTGTDALLPELERHRTAHAEQLARYREIEARDFAENPTPRQKLHYQVLKAGIGFEAAWIAWCDDAIAMLHDMTPTESPGELR